MLGSLPVISAQGIAGAQGGLWLTLAGWAVGGACSPRAPRRASGCRPARLAMAAVLIAALAPRSTW
jgi:hypothetical protein